MTQPYMSLLAVLAVLLVACSGGEAVDVPGGEGDDAAGGEAPAQGGTLVAAISAEPDQLDPHLTTASPSFTINEQIYETLVQTTPDLQFEPELATEWSTSEDQLTWTFTIREGVTFHDGGELTAEDVVYSLQRVKDEDTGAANAYRLATVKKISAPDDTTVEIRLSEPGPNLLANLSNGGLAIVSQDAVEDGTIESDPVGTGPFTFVSYSEGSNLKLEANPDYWDGAPSLEGVEFRFISEGTVALTALETGEIDWTDNIPPQNIETVLANDQLGSEAVPSTDYWYYSLNHEREPFDDPKVREALAYAFDREALTQAAKFDAATPNQTAIPEGSFWYSDYAPYSHDPDRARRLLDEAGASDLRVGLLVSGEFPETVQAAQVLESQWGEVGVNVRIQSVEFATWLDRNASGDFDAKLLGWLGNVDPNDFYYSQHHSKGQNNTQNYDNPEVDELLDEARIETDEQARKQLYDQAVKLIVDDNSYTYLYNPDIVAAWQPGVSGYEVRPDGLTLFAPVTLQR